MGRRKPSPGYLPYVDGGAFIFLALRQAVDLGLKEALQFCDVKCILIVDTVVAA